MLIVGIDENGLGPLLGPLIVTGTVFEAPNYDRQTLWKLAQGSFDADDSKRVFSRRTLPAAERATRAWLEAFGIRAQTHTELEQDLVRRPPWDLPCPDAPLAPCLPSADNLPLWADATPPTGQPAQLPAGLGVRPVRAGSLIACVGAINAALARDGMNKLRLDFEMMLHLLADLTADRDGEDVLAICGKVGSTRRYGRWLDGLGRYLWSPLSEEPAQSSYRIAEIGTLHFVRDADSLHLPVAVASMIGKYLRELAMRPINTILGANWSEPVSGYRDPRTKRFVEETVASRQKIGLADACFLRQR